ncbi:MAG: CinA family protein [Candidatus Omnitrophota bacterium]
MIKKLKKIITILAESKKTLALAESASGGYASYLLTKTPGASKVFKGAIIAYSLESKNKFFKISGSGWEKTQGVSKKIALQLASGIRKKFNTDIGASLVGFAGPQTKKGVKAGTTFIALSSRNRRIVKKIVVKGSRDTIRKKTSAHLINLIYKSILPKA